MASVLCPQLGIMYIFTTELFVSVLYALYIHLILYYATDHDLYHLSPGPTANEITLAKARDCFKVQ